MHVAVPLHVELMQAVEVQVTVVPPQTPPEQASLNVHGSPSLHATDVRQAQVPPALVQRYVVPPHVMDWHRSWLAALHVCTVPPEQIPSAPAGPQPTHV